MTLVVFKYSAKLDSQSSHFASHKSSSMSRNLEEDHLRIALTLENLALVSSKTDLLYSAVGKLQQQNIQC